MQVQRRCLIVLFSLLFPFLLVGCIVSGNVVTISLPSESVIGGENVTGAIAVSIETNPADGNCQPPPSQASCLVRITAQPADVVQISGDAFPGLVTPEQGIVFADQNLQATFEMQTNPVSAETVVTISAAFLLCPPGRLPGSIDECRPQPNAQEVTLVVQPPRVADSFTCDEPFDYGDKRKPPLPIRNNLEVPPGFENLVLNPTYVVGFNFVSANVALIAQPIGAVCDFKEPTFGWALGVVWHVVGSEAESFVLAAPPNADEGIVEGFLFLNQEERISVDFMVEQLQPVEPQAALPLDVSIRASSVCFRIESRRYCSVEESDGGQLLSVRELFSDIYVDQVASRIRRAQDLLQGAGLHNPDAQVLEFDAISEIEQPDRIKECVEDAESCIADLIMAPVIPPELAHSRSAQPVSLTYQQELEIAILILPEALVLPPDDDGNTLELPAGDYVLYAQQSDDALIDLPVIARGIPDPQQAEDIIEVEVPAVIMPYVDPEGVGIVAIHDVGIYEWVCLFWEQCAFLNAR